jgi:outer membrane protein assembly factor BamB
MNTDRQQRKHVWIIAGLLVLTLLGASMTGCNKATVSGPGSSTTSGVVNSTLVDVDGLLTAPTKTVTSYSTEALNLGNDGYAGTPRFLDGVLYTFSERGSDQWTTAWDQSAGKKLWSVPTNATTDVTSDELIADGSHLFFVSWDRSSGSAPAASIVCVDKATGATTWKYPSASTSSFSLSTFSTIAIHISKESNTADRLYILGEEVERSGSATKSQEVTPKVGNPGISILDAVTGTLLGRIDWPAFSTFWGDRGQLLCDGTTLYAAIPESIEAEQPTPKSSLAAFDLTTNKMLWKESVDGESSCLFKQGDTIIFCPNNLEVWKIGTKGATRLWTRAPEVSPSFAVDRTHVYLQGKNGSLVALDLATGKEVWKQQFAVYRVHDYRGSDFTTLHDLYPVMTLTTTRDVLYVQDGGGLVAALDPATGTKLWNKRISQVDWHQTYVANMFVLQPVEKGFLVITDDGKVTLWK